MFISFGLLSIFMGFKEMFDARLKAAFIVQEKQIPWGNSNYTQFSWLNVTTEGSRAETIVHDTLWNICFLTIIVSFMLFAIGKASLRATEKQKSRVAERMFGRVFFMFLTFLVFYVFTRKQSRSFKATFDWIKEHDNQTNIFDNATIVSNLTETPKRNLRAKHTDFERFNKMFEMQDKLFDQIDSIDYSKDTPQDIKKMMKAMKKINKRANRDQKRYEEQHSEIEYDDDENDYYDHEFDFKREVYRIYAPALYEHAQRAEARNSHHHGPTVQADKDKNAVKDWPKMQKMCPVMLFFIFACIHQICRLKFLEKELAKLEFLQKAKKLVKKTCKKQVIAASSEQKPQMHLATPQTQIVAQMPVAPKKCKKTKAKAVAVQPQLIMPVIHK